MKHASDTVMTSDEVIAFIKVSKHTFYKNWNRWCLRPILLTARPLRFWKSDIVAMLEKNQVKGDQI